MSNKRTINSQKKSEDHAHKKSSLGRETSFAESEHRSIPSLQHDSTKHVGETLPDELDPSWFKICRGKALRQNLNPFLEARKALGMTDPAPVLLRPPASDSVTIACNRPFRKPGDDIDCFFFGIKVSIKTMPSRGLVGGSGEPKFSPSETCPEQVMS
jgi:hypothetical protein